jgi:UDP-N-acetylmuramyl pentapeptide phosphotransferase/UDP-N-acetylglucosamine-1-phosphate transferase
MSALAVLLGLVVGAGLAVPVGLRLRRRAAAAAAANGTRAPGSRPSILGTSAQRKRALWIAVGFATASVIALAAGAKGVASPLMLVALLLMLQTVLFGAIDRLRRISAR